MTNTQREALKLMRKQNVAAVVTRLGWTWLQHVRESEEAASAVMDVLSV